MTYLRHLAQIATVASIALAATLAPVNADAQETATVTEQDSLEESYALSKGELQADRSRFKQEMGERPNLEMLRGYLTSSLVHRILPAWSGTPWDFNGTTAVPRRGSIACGYFISTTLRDLGYRLDRYALARLPSEQIIAMFVAEEDIHRYSDTPLERFCGAVEEQGEGVYIVGLDYHVGFLVQCEDGTRFIHSSFMAPYCVVDEDARTSAVLENSRYRVTGKLFDDTMVLAWLAGGPIE